MSLPDITESLTIYAAGLEQKIEEQKQEIERLNDVISKLKAQVQDYMAQIYLSK